MVASWDHALTPRAARDDYMEAAQAFLDSPLTTRPAIEYGCSFHNAEHPIRNPGQVSTPENVPHANDELFFDLSPEHVAARVQFAIEAKARVDEYKATAKKTEHKAFVFNNMHLAFFIYAKEGPLRVLCQQEANVLLENLRFIPPLLKLFSGKKLATELQADGARSKEDEERRNTAERDAAAERDGNRCVPTKAVCPDVAHIWPFSMNNDPKKFMTARGLFLTGVDLLVEGSLDQSLMLSLVAPVPVNGKFDLACSDKAWNMLCLNPQIHRYWTKAFFGFKPTSLSTNGTPWLSADGNPDPGHVRLTVEWRWLSEPISKALQKQFAPQNGTTATALTEATLEAESSLLATFIHQRTGCSPTQCQNARANRVDTGRPLETGNLIDLKVKSNHLKQTQLMLETQWLVVQMAALSGAAEVYDDIDGEEPPRPSKYNPEDITTLGDDLITEEEGQKEGSPKC